MRVEDITILALLLLRDVNDDVDDKWERHIHLLQLVPNKVILENTLLEYIVDDRSPIDGHINGQSIDQLLIVVHQCVRPDEIRYLMMTDRNKTKKSLPSFFLYSS